MNRITGVEERLKSAAGTAMEALSGAAAPLLKVLVGIAILLLVLICWKHLRPRRRIGFAVVPDPGFDPSDEEIIRYSLGLAEARSAVGFGSDSHRMVRLTICSDDQGKLVSLVGLNPRARSVAERNGWSGCDLLKPEEILGSHTPKWLPTDLAVDDDQVIAEPEPQDTVDESDRVIDSVDVTDRPVSADDQGWSFLEEPPQESAEPAATGIAALGLVDDLAPEPVQAPADWVDIEEEPVMSGSVPSSGSRWASVL